MLPLIVIISALIFLAMLVVINGVIPFAAMSGGMGGDDYNYFQSSLRELPTLGSWFDLNQFPAFEQGGYPLVLTWINQVADDSLIARKGLNVLFYLLISVMWYQIGSEMGGRRTARSFAVAILLGTPFWTYWIYLLKDMTIVLLQSVFLLGLVRLVVTPARNRGQWLVIGLSTLLLIPFRLALVVLNAAVLSSTLVVLSHRSTLRKVSMLIAGAILLGSIYLAGSNAAVLGVLGVRGTGRSLTQLQLSYEALTQQSLSEQGKYAGVRGAILFPVLYVIGETTGFRANEAFSTFGPEAGRDIVLRGVVAVPWIFLGTPFFVIGLLRVTRRARRRTQMLAGELGPASLSHLNTLRASDASALSFQPTLYPHSFDRADEARSMVQLSAEKRAWVPLLIYLLVYAFVAWAVRDTTRWRMPAFPVMLAIAVNGLLLLSPRKRVLIAATWTGVLALALLLYYFTK